MSSRSHPRRSAIVTEARKTIPELSALYRLHPEFRDIYVEGDADRRLFAEVARRLGARNTSVYKIDSVLIPASLAIQHGRADNNRARVVALAVELSRTVTTAAAVSCIVDADFEHILPLLPQCPLLLVTDFACAEMYFFDGLRALCARCFSPEASAHYHRISAHFSDILIELSLIRIVSHELNWGTALLEHLKRFITISRDSMSFDRERYIVGYLHKAGRHHDADIFEAAVERWRSRLPSEGRLYFNGHDASDLLHAFILDQHSTGLDGSSIRALISRALFAALAPDELMSYGLFIELSRRISG